MNNTILSLINQCTETQRRNQIRKMADILKGIAGFCYHYSYCFEVDCHPLAGWLQLTV